MQAKASSVITSIIDNAPEDEPRRGAKHFHASGLHNCQRQQVAELMGHTGAKRTKPEWRRAADFGNLIHDYIIGVAEKQGILESAELSLDVDPEYFVSGRVDAILKRGARRVLEIKSMNARGYKEFHPDNPKFEAAFYQIQWYMQALDITDGFILAVERDSCVMKEFSVSQDSDTILYLRSRMRRLKGYLDNGIIPGAEKSDGGCFFCQFKNTDICKDELEDWLDKQ